MNGWPCDCQWYYKLDEFTARIAKTSIDSEVGLFVVTKEHLVIIVAISPLLWAKQVQKEVADWGYSTLS